MEIKEKPTQSNPLKQYFRSIKMYLILPSGQEYYNSDVLEYTDSGEVGVMPMTGVDEISLKNPDALLNGEAIIGLIKSCAPAVKQPTKLLSNDIEALITAIRHVTFGKNLDIMSICPACGHENAFSLELRNTLDQMSFLEPEYIVSLDNGLDVYIHPYTFPDLLKGLHVQFGMEKLSRELSKSGASEEEMMAKVSTKFGEIAQVNIELMTNCITKIKVIGTEDKVDNKEFIKDFLKNTDKLSIEKIDSMMKEVNKIGLKRSFTATCEKCNHNWESDMEFNPVNFS